MIDETKERRRVCFVALRAYNVLSGDRGSRHIGGAEVQQSLIARGLARRGHQVRVVTLDHGQVDGEAFDGVQVLKSYREESGLPGLRFFWPRVGRLWGALRRADAEIYYQRTSDSLTGVVAAFCRRRGRKFVFAAGAMEDCDPALPNCPTRHERYLYRYGIRRADLVVTQTWEQASLLLRHFGKASVVVRSAAPDPGPVSPPDRSRRPRMIWVGRIASEKRPELFLDLARSCPEMDFDLVGSGLSGRLIPGPDAPQPENLHFHGYVPHDQVARFYEEATALVCTSRAEGFPNTFLEAWSRGRPVLSTCDPDGMIAEQGLGLVADPDQLASRARQLCASIEEWHAVSARARAHYLREHSPRRVLDTYETLLSNLAHQGLEASTLRADRLAPPREI